MEAKTEVFNWPIIGNRSIVKYLNKVITDKKTTHAYLFTGPEHVGKLTTAKYFVDSLLCQKNHQLLKKETEITPHQRSNDCLNFFQKTHPDVYLIDRLEGNKDISIDQIQQFRHKLKMTSFYDGYKFGIINQAEFMNDSSVSALLKTLEEPTKKTIIILIANNISKIPATIISRCQVINFQIVSNKDIERGLLKLGLPRESVFELAHLAMGKPGLAINYHESPGYLEDYRAQIEKFIQIRNTGLSERIDFYNQFIGDHKEFQEVVNDSLKFINIWQIILRDLILTKNNLLSFIVNYLSREKLEIISKKSSQFSLWKEIGSLQLVRKRLKSNINPRLLIENFLISLN